MTNQTEMNAAEWHHYMTHICVYMYYSARRRVQGLSIDDWLSTLILSDIYTTSSPMGWLQWLGSITLFVSFAEYSLFYRAILQKRPIILSILLTEATAYNMHTNIYFGHVAHPRMTRSTVIGDFVGGFSSTTILTSVICGVFMVRCGYGNILQMQVFWNDMYSWLCGCRHLQVRVVGRLLELNILGITNVGRHSLLRIDRLERARHVCHELRHVKNEHILSYEKSKCVHANQKQMWVYDIQMIMVKDVYVCTNTRTKARTNKRTNAIAHADKCCRVGTHKFQKQMLVHVWSKTELFFKLIIRKRLQQV